MSLGVDTSLLGLARLASPVAGSWWCGEAAFPELLAVSTRGSHSIAVNSVTLAADKAPQPASLEPGASYPDKSELSASVSKCPYSCVLAASLGIHSGL